jgi:hypothetical protein
VVAYLCTYILLMKKDLTILIALFITGHFTAFMLSGCAQISAPTGGPKDTIAPVLVKSSPESHSVRFSGNRITISFNEYIELKDLSDQLIISPLPKQNPLINSSLKTISIKLKDTLLPNTTYSFNFGNAIRDINEGNAMKSFNYCFSTGEHIDSFSIKGKVILAESGKADSTIKVLLYRNAADTAVLSRRPDYISRLNGQGEFIFSYLPRDVFSIFALKDGDGNKWYNSGAETFGFIGEPVESGLATTPVKLLAYVEKAVIKSAPAALPSKKGEEKRLRFTTNLMSGKLDQLQPLNLQFSAPLKKMVTDSILLCDTNYLPIKNYELTIDSSRKNIQIHSTWLAEQPLRLLLNKNGLEDSTGLTLLKTDTLRFAVKGDNEYGQLKINFKNIDLAKHPLLQFMEGETVKWKFAITSNEWINKKMLPGEYECRILYDLNNNGQWDAGDYSKKLQPEQAITLPQKIAIKADWENERDVEL